MTLIPSDSNRTITPNIPHEEGWIISKTKDNKFLFERFFNGKIIETYSTQNKEVSAIYAVSIILDFQPPRALVHQDKPVG